MTRTHAILAAIALVLWLAAYAWFFRRDVQHVFKRRAARRAQAAREQAARAAHQAKLRDDLARRYPVPPSGPDPSG